VLTTPCSHSQTSENQLPPPHTPHTHTRTHTAMAKVFAKYKMLVAMSKHIEVEEVCEREARVNSCLQPVNGRIAPPYHAEARPAPFPQIAGMAVLFAESRYLPAEAQIRGLVATLASIVTLTDSVWPRRGTAPWRGLRRYTYQRWGPSVHTQSHGEGLCQV
jgi:hypothetical protein